MPILTIRVSDDFKRRLKLQARRQGRSVAVHIRKILADEMAGELVSLHHFGFTTARQRGKRGRMKKAGLALSVLRVPLTIQRKDVDWDVEVEVKDFYIRKHPRFSQRLCCESDDVNEVHLTSEGVVKKTGKRIALTASEISRAELKFWKLLEQKR